MTLLSGEQTCLKVALRKNSFSGLSAAPSWPQKALKEIVT